MRCPSCRSPVEVGASVVLVRCPGCNAKFAADDALPDEELSIGEIPPDLSTAEEGPRAHSREDTQPDAPMPAPARASPPGSPRAMPSSPIGPRAPAPAAARPPAGAAAKPAAPPRPAPPGPSSPKGAPGPAKPAAPPAAATKAAAVKPGDAPRNAASVPRAVVPPAAAPASAPPRVAGAAPARPATAAPASPAKPATPPAKPPVGLKPPVPPSAPAAVVPPRKPMSADEAAKAAAARSAARAAAVKATQPLPSDPFKPAEPAGGAPAAVSEEEVSLGELPGGTPFDPKKAPVRDGPIPRHPSLEQTGTPMGKVLPFEEEENLQHDPTAATQAEPDLQVLAPTTRPAPPRPPPPRPRRRSPLALIAAMVLLAAGGVAAAAFVLPALFRTARPTPLVRASPTLRATATEAPPTELSAEPSEVPTPTRVALVSPRPTLRPGPTPRPTAHVRQGSSQGSGGGGSAVSDDDLDFLTAKADVLVGTGKYAAARAEYEKVIGMKRSYPPAHLGLAKVLDQMNDPKDACREWRTYLELAPAGKGALLAAKKAAGCR